MVRINFVTYDGSETSVDAKPGYSIMEAAIRSDVPGIDAECGGACACGTCHVYIDEAWLDKLERAAPAEQGMLECADDVRPNSRLSCQLKIREDMDGIVVHTPQSQSSQT